MNLCRDEPMDVGMNLQNGWDQGRDEKHTKDPATETCMKEKNTRRLPYICYIYMQQMQGSLRVFFFSTMFT